MDNEENLGERWWDEENSRIEDVSKLPELIDDKDYDEEESEFPKLLYEETENFSPSFLHRIQWLRGLLCTHYEFEKEDSEVLVHIGPLEYKIGY